MLKDHRSFLIFMKYQSLSDQKLYGPEFYARISVTGAYRVRCLLTTAVDIGPFSISVSDKESCHWEFRGRSQARASLFTVSKGSWTHI
jgi:hypothetical protein